MGYSKPCLNEIRKSDSAQRKKGTDGSSENPLLPCTFRVQKGPDPESQNCNRRPRKQRQFREASLSLSRCGHFTLATPRPSRCGHWGSGDPVCWEAGSRNADFRTMMQHNACLQIFRPRWESGARSRGPSLGALLSLRVRPWMVRIAFITQEAELGTRSGPVLDRAASCGGAEGPE